MSLGPEEEMREGTLSKMSSSSRSDGLPVCDNPQRESMRHKLAGIRGLWSCAWSG